MAAFGCIILMFRCWAAEGLTIPQRVGRGVGVAGQRWRGRSVCPSVKWVLEMGYGFETMLPCSRKSR